MSAPEEERERTPEEEAMIRHIKAERRELKKKKHLIKKEIPDEESLVEMILAQETETVGLKARLRLYYQFHRIGWAWLKPRLLYYTAFSLLFSLPLAIEKAWFVHVGGPDVLCLTKDEMTEIPQDGSFDQLRLSSEADMAKCTAELAAQRQSELDWAKFLEHEKQNSLQ